MSPKISAEIWKSHLILLLQTAWPNIITALIQLAIPVSSTLFVGHIGPSVLIGAAALGNMFGNATGFAIGSGLSMALDTLCSQAFGAKKYMLVGLHCQRAMTILTIICFPIAIVWWNAHFVLQFIGSEETAILSQRWLKLLLPSIWPRIMYEAYRRYLLGQRILWPITLSVSLVAPIHILNTYLFVFKFGYGFEGAAVAVDISYWLLFTILVVVSTIRVRYLRKRAASGHQMLEMTSKLESASEDEEEIVDEDNGDPLHTWPKLSMDIFRGWGAFLRLGGATAASLFIEWGSFEVNAAIASSLGEVSLATHAILSNFASVWYATPVGIASATTAWVGNTLGAGESDRAWIFARLGYAINLTFAIVNGACGMIYKNYLGAAVTDDEGVRTLVGAMIPVLWVYGIVDALKAVGMAVLRGSGRPVITVVGNILSCLVVGYPVALLLVFKGHFELQGLWFGMSSAWLVACTLYGIVIARTNWQQEVERAAARNKEALLSRSKSTVSLLAEEGKATTYNFEQDGFSIGDDGEDGAGPNEEDLEFEDKKLLVKQTFSVSNTVNNTD